MKQYMNIKATVPQMLFLILCIIFPFKGKLFAQEDALKADTIKKYIETGAISTVSGSKLNTVPSPTMSNTLYGQLRGLIVTQGTQEPGNDRAILSIRGRATYNDAEPVVYVDGFQVPMTYFQGMSSSEIGDISILKDAAALAVYGMKGANGVILVQTKRGTKGKIDVRLQARTGIRRAYDFNKPLGSYEYANLYNQAISNDNDMVWSPLYNAQQLSGYKNGTGLNVDWYDEVLKKNAMMTEGDLSVSGGNDYSTYRVVFSYLNQQGLYNVKNDDLHSNLQYKRYNLMANVDLKLSEIFEAKIDVSGRIEDRARPNYATESLFNNLANYPSNIYPVKNENGSWTGNTIYPDNPLASITELGYMEYHDRTLKANFILKENLDFVLPGLYLSESVSFSNYNRGTYSKTRDYARFDAEGNPSTNNKETVYSVKDDYGTDSWDWKQFMLTAGYSNTFGKHDISSVLNFMASTEKMQLGNEGGTSYNYANMSGLLHYEYDKRYVAELGFSYSGSDYYSPDNRWGFYPAVSLGWVLSNESFLSGCNGIDYLKLRASVGKTGMNNGGRYAYQQYYIYQGYYGIGSSSISSVQGVTQSTIANPLIFAEKSMKYNIGFDARFLNKFSAGIDVFMDKRTGIITQDYTVPGVFGGKAPYGNIGKVTNKGIEVELNYSNSWNGFTLNAGIMGMYAVNNIDEMGEVITIPNAAKTGNPINTKFGYLVDGFYQLSDFNADGSYRENVVQSSLATVQPGDLKYKDISGPNGIPDGKIDDFDKTKIGNPDLPKYSLAFTLGGEYKGFDLQMLFQGAFGRDVTLLNNWNQVVPFQNNGNVYEIARNAWAYYPEQGIDTRAHATFPRLSVQGNNNNYAASDFWIKDGSFLRLRSVELGWTLPSSLARKAYLKNARIFIQGGNLFTISKLLKDYNMDPETYTGYPVQRTYMLGLTLNF